MFECKVEIKMIVNVYRVIERNLYRFYFLCAKMVGARRITVDHYFLFQFGVV